MHFTLGQLGKMDMLESSLRIVLAFAEDATTPYSSQQRKLVTLLLVPLLAGK